MYKSKHKPPSRIRYEQNNPVVSIRMPKEWVDELDAFLDEQDLSRGDFFRTSFEKQKINYHRAYMQGDKEGYGIGYNAGYEKGMQDWGIRIPCNICQEELYLPPNSDWHKLLIEYFKQRGWGHKECHEQ